jgi:hypothetical protein
MKHDAAEGSKRASQFAEHPYPSYRRGRPTQRSANTGKRRRGELQVEASQPLISRLVTNPNGSERLKRLWCLAPLAREGHAVSTPADVLFHIRAKHEEQFLSLTRHTASAISIVVTFGFVDVARPLLMPRSSLEKILSLQVKAERCGETLISPQCFHDDCREWKRG